MNIGEQIKKYRLAAKMSQRELGEKLGLSQQQIAQYENGKRTPKIETLNNIAGALNVGLKRLYPEYRQEWLKTETYRIARQNHAIRESILGIFSTLYGNVEIINIDSDRSKYTTEYVLNTDKKIYTLTIEDLNKIVDFLLINIPFLLDTICTDIKTKDSSPKKEAPTE